MESSCLSALLAAVVLCVCRGAGGSPAPRHVILDAPGHVCVEGMGTTARGGEPGTSFTIVDWLGRETGHIGAFDTNGCATVPPLPTGYYRMFPLVTRHSSPVTGKGDETIATLAVVPPPEGRPRPAESFYGVDTGPIWQVADPKRGFACPWNDGDALQTLADLVWLCGVSHVRDRVSPEGVMPKADAFDGGYFLRNAHLFTEHGIDVCDVFCSAPQWTVPLQKMPTDLAATFSLCARLGAEFGANVDGWEFWNEPDINFAPGPVWDYAAAMKAAYLGFASVPGTPTAMPAAHCHAPGSHYAIALYDNDAAKFAPGFNYHCYSPLAQLPACFAKLRTFLEVRGMGNRPVWITEVGCSNDGNALDTGPMPQFKAHSPEQELFVAETCPKQLIGLQMEGVARAYWFIFGAYNEREGQKDWGMMRRDGTVKPVFSALSALVEELGMARIAGEMRLAKGVRAFLFDQPDGSQTLAFWTTSAADGDGGFGRDPPDASAEIELTIALPEVSHEGTGARRQINDFRLCDMCGMVSSVAAMNGVLALRATRHPSYVSGLRGLVPDTPAFPTAAMPHVPTPAPDEDLTLIVRVELNEDDFAVTRNKTRAVLKGDTGRLRLLVWNLGDAAKTGTVEVAGVRLEGLPDAPFVLGARGSRPAVFDCTLVPDGGGFDRTMEARAVFAGRRGSRTCVPVWFERLFLSGCVESPLACEDPARWKRFDSAKRLSFSFDEAEHALRIDAEWNDDASAWSYPSFRLEKGESLAGAKAIAFEVKSAQDKVENDFKATRLRIAGFTDTPFLPPNENWEQRCVELPDGDLAGVRSFLIGAEPRGKQLTLWLRNVRVLFPKSP